MLLRVADLTAFAKGYGGPPKRHAEADGPPYIPRQPTRARCRPELSAPAHPNSDPTHGARR
jgi:hypothetical protein